jgi:hypothetical protein
MNRAHSGSEVWHPQTREEKETVLREMHAILESPQFSNSKRYPAFLEYIVRNTLAGRSELLKERTLGVEVFHRAPTYDTNSDTIVRYTAGEVRKRLLLYYSANGSGSNLRISLPVGSYIPEFLCERDGGGEREPASQVPAAVVPEPSVAVPEVGHAPQAAPTVVANPPANGSEAPAAAASRHRMTWLIAAVAVAAAVVCGLWWNVRSRRPQSALDTFWAPVLGDSRPIEICTGSVVFAQNNYSGVTTAGKDLDYTFVSMQIASAIAEVSSVAVRAGATSQLVFSASTPVTELREHPVILLGAYNNQWTLRLLDSLRFHFAPEPEEAIVDRTQPARRWQRDQSQPYSSADDYAIVARFHDPTIDAWVVALAGLGRNGTETAAQFATSPHYLELLRQQLGTSFGNKNLEVVLKTSVIDGKSGAPSILAVHTW